jgi:cytosine/uracil/thiamine/allantoin permease
LIDDWAVSSFTLGESNATFYISIFIGTTIFSLALALSGDAGQLTTASGYAIAAFTGSGIIGVVMGRWLSFTSLRLIGANITNPLKIPVLLFLLFWALHLWGNQLP